MFPRIGWLFYRDVRVQSYPPLPAGFLITRHQDPTCCCKPVAKVGQACSSNCKLYVCADAPGVSSVTRTLDNSPAHYPALPAIPASSTCQRALAEMPFAGKVHWKLRIITRCFSLLPNSMEQFAARNPTLPRSPRDGLLQVFADEERILQSKVLPHVWLTCVFITRHYPEKSGNEIHYPALPGLP